MNHDSCCGKICPPLKRREGEIGREKCSWLLLSFLPGQKRERKGMKSQRGIELGIGQKRDGRQTGEFARGGAELALFPFVFHTKRVLSKSYIISDVNSHRGL